MELREIIQQRKSIRAYKPDPLNRGLVNDIVEQARRAPSAGALRGYQIIITDKQLTRYDAPLHIVICAVPKRYAAKYGERGRELYSVQDATLVGAYIQLLAVDVGLDTVWVGAFREARIKQILELEDGLRPIAVLPIGYRR